MVITVIFLKMHNATYHPRQRVLLAARLEFCLAAGSRPRNGDECHSLALWAVREPTRHWRLVFCLQSSEYNTTTSWTDRRTCRTDTERQQRRGYNRRNKRQTKYAKYATQTNKEDKIAIKNLWEIKALLMSPKQKLEQTWL